jgi:hypothetical protein
VASQVPAIIKEFQGGGSGDTDLGSKYVGDVKIAVEDKDSRVVYSEQVEDIEKEIDEMMIDELTPAQKAAKDAYVQSKGGRAHGGRAGKRNSRQIRRKSTSPGSHERGPGKPPRPIDIWALGKKNADWEPGKILAKKKRGSKTASRYEDIEKEIEGMGEIDEGKESAAYKANRAEYDKLMKKWGNTPITKIPWKEFARIRELGDSFYDTKAGSGLKVGDLLQHMKETYAPLSEELAYLQSKDGKQTFVIGPRDTRGMRGKQDKFSMYIVNAKTGKKIEDLGSHVSLKGAIKYALNRGFVRSKKQKGSTSEIKYNQSPDELSKSFRYDTLTGKRNESSGGGGHPRKALNFDERQKAYASAYRNVHKKAPSRDELRAAGVGKGFEKSFGDTSKGVKAWKAAMAALKGK